MFCTQLGISFSLERKCWSTVPGWLIRGLFIQTNNFIHCVYLWGLCFIVYSWSNVAQSSAGQLFRVSGINSWLIYKDRDSFEELIYSDFPGVLLFLRKTTELRAAPWHSKSLGWYVTHTMSADLVTLFRHRRVMLSMKRLAQPWLYNSVT